MYDTVSITKLLRVLWIYLEIAFPCNEVNDTRPMIQILYQTWFQGHPVNRCLTLRI